MQKKEVLFVVKMVLIIAIIFAAISFILPWRDFSMNVMTVNMGMDFYPWGEHVHMGFPNSYSQYMPDNGSMDVWSIFYTINTGSVNGLDVSQNLESIIGFTNENFAAIASFFISFVLGFLAIIFGILSIKRNKLILVAGVLAVFSIIMFIAGFSIGLSEDIYEASNMIPYTLGFYLMIMSAILFFVSFGLNYAVKVASSQGPVPPNYGSPTGTESKETQKENIENKSVYQDSAVNKKVCSNCGMETQGNASYCTNCGKKLE